MESCPLTRLDDSLLQLHSADDSRAKRRGDRSTYRMNEWMNAKFADKLKAGLPDSSLVMTYVGWFWDLVEFCISALPRAKVTNELLQWFTQDRVGGRIATFRKGNYVADLGAMVVTGLGKVSTLWKCWCLLTFLSLLWLDIGQKFQ